MKNIFDAILNSDSFQSAKRELSPLKETILHF